MGLFMLESNLPAAGSYNRNYTGFTTAEAGAEEAFKALAIKRSLPIENGLIAGIERRKELNKQEHTGSL